MSGTGDQTGLWISFSLITVDAEEKASQSTVDAAAEVIEDIITCP